MLQMPRIRRRCLKVAWPDETVGGNSEQTDEALTALLSDDCAGRGVDQVRVDVNTSGGATLKSATFPCVAKTVLF